MILMVDGRISFRELAERVHLSANAVADRVRRLQRDGVILGFGADLSSAALGRSLTAMIDIRLRPGVTMDDAEVELRRLPQLLSATHVTGRSDYVLRVACRDAVELDELIRALNSEVGAVETETRILLREIRPAGPPF
jgi:Lrp/AsnC family leucine-responsive transcriptional regulator